MTWADLQTLLTYLYGPYVGNDFINSSSGSPTELALLCQLANNRIATMPAVELECLKITSTITLTGATFYNLKTLFPDLRSVYQIYGINSNMDHPYRPNYESNVTPLEGWTVKGKTLYFTGNAPTGTANIQYKSQYLVESASGTRKLNFTADDDISVLDEADINALVFGVGEFVNWRVDTASQERKAEIKLWFKEAITNLGLTNVASHQLTSMI